MRPLPLLTLLFTLTFAASGLLSSFDGFDGAQLPIPQEDPPIQPPGWAFAIWGPIYAGLLASAAWGLWRRAGDAGWDRVRRPLLLSLAVGTPWLAVAERSAEAATAMIVVMTALAIAATLRAPRGGRLPLLLPVGLYAGWLTAASFVALGSLAGGYGADPTRAAVACTLGAVVAAVAVLLRRRDAGGFALAVAWALFALAGKNYEAETWVTPIAVTGVVAALALGWRGIVGPTAT